MTEKVRAPFFFNPLRSRLLWIFVVAHGAFALVLGDVMAFAPDEGGYLGIFNELYSRNFSFAGHLGWVGTTPTLYLQVVYLPAKLLTYLGIPTYLALRILAIALSTISVYLLLCIAKYQGSKEKFFSRALIAVLIIPTSFMWMSLSLREEFLYLGFSAFVTGLYLMNRTRSRPAMFLLTLGAFLVCYTKGYLFVALVFAAIALLLIRVILQRKLAMPLQYVALAILIPLIFAPATSRSLISAVAGQITGAQGALTASDGTGSSAPISSTSGSTSAAMLAAEVRANPNSLFSQLALKSKLVSPSTAPSTAPSTPTADLDKKRVDRLSLQPGHIRKPLTLITSSARFLFLPSPFIDNGSKFQNIGSYEEIIWWGLYLLVGFMIFRLIRSHRKIDDLFIWATTFSLFFIIISAVTEINVGTSLRHRSILLIPILAIILTCQISNEEVPVTSVSA